MRRLQRILTSKILIFGLLIIAQIGLIVYGIYWITQWIVPVYVLLTVLDVAVVLYVINSRIVPAYKINWLIMAAIFPLATGILTLKGGNTNSFARYQVDLQANVSIPTGGAVTPIAVAITLNGVAVPDSVAILDPAAVEDVWHVNTSTTITVPCGCCVSVSAA
ncbi:MAG: hypothetical protein IKG35_02745, partial [Erysipelotrichaceae bacterium]|nr:hypothetical protein [Erysipelotrichaceae bacterium]